MNIIRKPFRELDEFFNEDDNWFFPLVSRKSTDPEMDLYETEKDIVAEISIPDIDPKNVKVAIEDNVLKITGEFEEKTEEGEKGKNYWKREIRKGSFSRAIRLPSGVDDEKADADYTKGILKITIPKKEPEKIKEKEIKIKSK